MIVIDTHVLLWWIGGESAKLTQAAKSALDSAHSRGAVRAAAISAWEITRLHDRGRIGLSLDPEDWIRDVVVSGVIEFIPLDREIAILGARLGPDFHKDPADRFIVATCLKLSASLVTADEQIRRYPHVTTIW